MPTPRSLPYTNTPLITATITVPYGDTGSLPSRPACASKIKDWQSEWSDLPKDGAKSANREYYDGWYFSLLSFLVSLPTLPLPEGGLHAPGSAEFRAFLWPCNVYHLHPDLNQRKAPMLSFLPQWGDWQSPEKEEHFSAGQNTTSKHCWNFPKVKRFHLVLCLYTWLFISLLPHTQGQKCFPHLHTV